MIRAVLALAVGTVLPSVAGAQTIIEAWFEQPTTRYSHGILGDAVEYGALRFGADNQVYEVVLPQNHVFEDVAPRLWDVTGDGAPEIIVIETDVHAGAALAIYGIAGKIAETPHIGTPNRWLAPIGAADMDGNGDIEIAYIDRPHLAKTLRVWRYTDGELVPVANVGGLTNHKIGETKIGGGLRDCDGVVEMITANADWTRVMATRLQEGHLTSRDMGPYADQESLHAATRCNG